MMETPATRLASSAPNRLRLPGLDGLRGVSIALVMLDHGLVPVLGGGAVAWWMPPGNTGVKIFFVLSGFLITRLLLEERHRTGHISIRRFYVRRAWRILPPYVFFLAAIAATGWYEVSRREWIASATLTLNFVQHNSVLGHTWSLSVEEQFYVGFPLVLAGLGLRRTAVLAGAAVVVLPILRHAVELDLPAARILSGVSNNWQADFIAWGGLLAMAERDERWKRMVEAVSRPWCAGIAVAALTVLEISRTAKVAHPGSGLAIAIILAWATADRTSVAARALNARPLVWLGTISYSLYLWQQVFLGGQLPHAFWERFPLSFGLALLAGALSYALFERPLRAHRRRLAEP